MLYQLILNRPSALNQACGDISYYTRLDLAEAAAAAAGVDYTIKGPFHWGANSDSEDTPCDVANEH